MNILHYILIIHIYISYIIYIYDLSIYENLLNVKTCLYLHHQYVNLRFTYLCIFLLGEYDFDHHYFLFFVGSGSK